MVGVGHRACRRGTNTGSGDVTLAMYDSAVLPAGTYQRSATSAFAVKNAVMILIALEG